ncbi:MAG: YaeQ family protein [Pseudomonadota bacterium]
MALGATIHVFTVRLAHVDRNIYETLDLRLARHPSESAEYLVTRLLAYCLEYSEGLAFSKGLSDPDEPAIVIRDLTGVLRCWIEVGLPEAPRLHKAAKAATRVVVYPTRDTAPWLARLAGERIHRAEHVEIKVIDTTLLAAFAARLTRRMDFDLSVSEGAIYIVMADATLSGSVEQVALVTSSAAQK